MYVKEPHDAAQKTKVSASLFGPLKQSKTNTKYVPLTNNMEDSEAEREHRSAMQRLRATFMKADDNGNGELDVDEFAQAFSGVLTTDDGDDLEAMQKLFMRVDANADGTVSWDEFASYMLLENQGTSMLRELETALNFDERPEMFHVAAIAGHRDLMTRLTHVCPSTGADRYVSSSRDGNVKIWNPKDMKLVKTIHTGTAWVTCAKLMPCSQKLAVSTFSRNMKLYDMFTYEQVGLIPDTEYPPLSMDVWAPNKRGGTEMVVFGDAGGCVRLFELSVNSLDDKRGEDRYHDNCKWKQSLHTDWVTQVKYVKDMNCVVASSLDKTLSIIDAELRIPVKKLEGHTKGVNGCDWSGIYKFVASCGQDRKVMLWNPFSLKPLATLLGHECSVIDVLVNEQHHQIITLGFDKQIKVWDIRNHRCLQTLTDREVYKPEDVLSVLSFDRMRHRLMTGHSYPKVYTLRTGAALLGLGHTHPVCRVLFNANFTEAVSGDTSGTICLWQLSTGRLRFRFSRVHGDHRMTTMTFDNRRRRLLTASEDGEVRIWNFSSGACLAVMHSVGNEEVTGLVCPGVGTVMGHQIVAAGWDRKISFYEDPGGNRSVGIIRPVRSLGGPKSDILSLCVLEGSSSLCAGMHDGEVWVWSMESGAVKRKLCDPAMKELPDNQQAIEALAPLSGRLRNVVAAAGADRMLRFWDVVDGRCLFEVYSGHKVGETITAVCIDAGNTKMATADSAGFIKMWSLHLQIGTQARMSSQPNSATERVMWRAHKSSVSSLDWADTPQGMFLLSSSSDTNVSLWSEAGALVGLCGMHTWKLEDPTTWRATEAEPLSEHDHANMVMAATPPIKSNNYHRSVMQSPSLADRYSFVDANVCMPITAPASVSKICESSVAERIYSAGRVYTSPSIAKREHSAAGNARVLDDDSSDGELMEPPIEVMRQWEVRSAADKESDVDVPDSLWMDEFHTARKTRITHAPLGPPVSKEFLVSALRSATNTRKQITSKFEAKGTKNIGRGKS